VAPVAPALPSASQPAVVLPRWSCGRARGAFGSRRRCSAARCRPAGHRAGDHVAVPPRSSTFRRHRSLSKPLASQTITSRRCPSRTSRSPAAAKRSTRRWMRRCDDGHAAHHRPVAERRRPAGHGSLSRARRERPEFQSVRSACVLSRTTRCASPAGLRLAGAGAFLRYAPRSRSSAAVLVDPASARLFSCAAPRRPGQACHTQEISIRRETLKSGERIMKRTVSNFGGLIAGVALMGIAATQLLGAPGDCAQRLRHDPDRRDHGHDYRRQRWCQHRREHRNDDRSEASRQRQHELRATVTARFATQPNASGPQSGTTTVTNSGLLADLRGFLALLGVTAPNNGKNGATRPSMARRRRIPARPSATATARPGRLARHPGQHRPRRGGALASVNGVASALRRPPSQPRRSGTAMPSSR